MASDVKQERPAQAGRLPRDLAVGAALLAVCALAWWAAMQIDEAPAALAQNVQPATFPKMVLGVIAILSALMMALGLRHREQARKAPPPIMLVTAALMIAFVLVFEAFGPLLAMGLFCLVMPVVWGARPSIRLVVFALSFPLAVHLVFVTALGV
ncbi:hypothetical protein LCGC14_2428610, partial [marine sediment metagenome]